MKRLWIYLLLAGIITIISYLAYHYYAPPYQIKTYSTINHDDTLRIAYIGDSWAFMHKDHHCKIAKVLKDGYIILAEKHGCHYSIPPYE